MALVGWSVRKAGRKSTIEYFSQPPQVGVEMADGVVGGDHVAETRRRIGLHGGQFAQPFGVRPPLGDQVVAGPVGVGIPERAAGHVGNRQPFRRNGNLDDTLGHAQPLGKKVAQRDHFFIGRAHQRVFRIVIVNGASL